MRRAVQIVLDGLLVEYVLLAHGFVHQAFEDRPHDQQVALVLDADLLKLVVVECLKTELDVFVANVGQNSRVRVQRLTCLPVGSFVALLGLPRGGVNLTSLGDYASLNVLKDHYVLDCFVRQVFLQHVVQDLRVHECESLLLQLAAHCVGVVSCVDFIGVLAFHYSRNIIDNLQI